MTTKEEILKILYENDGYISGEEIAKKIGVSRNSVWKGVNSLKFQGYNILTSQEGYKILIKDDAFDEYSIKKHLNNQHKIYLYKEETSSNTVAKSLCQKGEEEGSIVIVESQTAGRGRLGRSFISRSENGLYMSIILRPSIPAEQCVNITALGAVAVLEAIEEIANKECSIKWVNDIYIEDKKCCGILTEASFDFESGNLQYAVIGIGVNLCAPDKGFDEEIKEIACGVYENGCPKGMKARLCAEIVNKFFKLYRCIEERSYIKKYREKSNIIGKDVDVYIGDKVICGKAIDVDENANLIVKDSSGEIRKFNSGEARVRRKK